MQVRPFTPLSRSAMMSCSGIPQRPKPPTITVMPSRMTLFSRRSAKAAGAVGKTFLSMAQVRGSLVRGGDQDERAVAAIREAEGVHLGVGVGGGLAHGLLQRGGCIIHRAAAGREEVGLGGH